MTGTGDDRFDMTMMLCEDAAEAFLADGWIPDGFEPVACLLDELRALLEGPAPRPSAALAMLLDGAGPVAVSDLATRRSRRAAGLGVTAALVGLVTLGSAGVAAANGRLPKATQDAVADAIEAVTPFTVPHHLPADRDVSPLVSPPVADASAPRAVIVGAGGRRSSGTPDDTSVGTRHTGSGTAPDSRSAAGGDAAAEPARDATRGTGSESSGSGATADRPATPGAGESGSGGSGSGDGGSGSTGHGSADPAVASESADLTGAGSVGSGGSGSSGSSGGSDGSGGSSGGSNGPEVIEVDHSGTGG